MSPTSAQAAALLATWLSRSSSHARAASSSATPSTPRRFRTMARCSRQNAGKDGEGMLLRPAQRRIGPLGRPVEIAKFLTCGDKTAVHLAGREGPEAPFDCEEHGLVEMGHAVIDMTIVDQDASLGLQGLRFEIGRTQPPTEFQCGCGELACTIEITDTMSHLRFAQEQIAEGDAFGVAFEGSPGTPKPAAGRGWAGADGVVFPEPYRVLPCPAPVVLLVVDPVRGLARGDALVEAAEPPCGLGLRVEPVRLKAWGIHTDDAGGVQRSLPIGAA